MRPIAIEMLSLAILILIGASPEGGFYRYLDLTPSMKILPRGELEESIAADMKCFLLTVSGDTLVVEGFQHGEPFPVFGLASRITITPTESGRSWLMDGLRYDIKTDSHGRPVFLARLDGSGDPVTGRDGAASFRWEWENDGAVTVRPIDSAGHATAVKLYPVYAGSAAELDDNGDLVYFSFQSVAAAGFRYILDGEGRALSRVALDGWNHPVMSDDGILETRYTFDSAGNTVSVSYHGYRGELLPMDYLLPSRGNWEFDSRGRVINGCRIAFLEREYDENSLYVSEISIGLNGERVPDPQGRVVTIYQREIHGGITASMWYGVDGQPLEVAGVWATRRVYDSRGRVLETSTWDSGNRLTVFPGGFAYTRFSYTGSGELEMMSYYGINGEPVVNTVQGCHARDYRYDEEGNLAEIRFLGTDYRLMRNSSGYAGVIYRYGPEGMEETFYDEDGVSL